MFQSSSSFPELAAAYTAAPDPIIVAAFVNLSNILSPKGINIIMEVIVTPIAIVKANIIQIKGFILGIIEIREKETRTIVGFGERQWGGCGGGPLGFGT